MSDDRLYFKWTPMNECEKNFIQSTAKFIKDDAKERRLGKGHGSDVHPRCRSEIGVAGHYLMCKVLGIHWDGSWNTFHKPDVAGLEVRGTDSKYGHLIAYTTDPPDRMLMSVWVKEDLSGGYVKGHRLARVCQQPEYLKPLAELQPGSAKQWWFPHNQLDREITYDELLERYAIERCQV
jgi:hypothetical protein